MVVMGGVVMLLELFIPQMHNYWRQCLNYLLPLMLQRGGDLLLLGEIYNPPISLM